MNRRVFLGLVGAAIPGLFRPPAAVTGPVTAVAPPTLGQGLFYKGFPIVADPACQPGRIYFLSHPPALRDLDFEWLENWDSTYLEGMRHR